MWNHINSFVKSQDSENKLQERTFDMKFGVSLGNDTTVISWNIIPLRNN